MSRNWIVANILLCLVVGVLGWQLSRSVARFRVENDPSKIVPVEDVKKRISGEGELPAPQPPRRYDAIDFGVIPSQNLFAASRGAPEETETQEAAPAPTLGAKPVLVGVTLSGNDRLAIINDPSSSRGERRTKIVRLGDTFEGYTITDILANRMVLENGKQREIIPLYDPSKHPAPGGKTPILATRVVGFGGGYPSGTEGSARRVLPSIIPSRSPSTAASQPGTSRGRQGPVETPITRESGEAQVAPLPAETEPEGGQQSGQSWNERVDPQGRRIIRTPFGDIVRPEPKDKP